jgi:hypothetical protein
VVGCCIIKLLIEALSHKEEKKMFKKALSLLLSMMLVVTSLVATVVSVSAAGDSYFVSGCEELTGYKWAETEAM